MKQKIEIEVEIPEGYEATGEMRVVGIDEYYLNRIGELKQWGSKVESVTQYIILRKVEPEQPQYKSFEINWRTFDYPTYNSHSMEIGRLLVTDEGNYRIFGFGNWPEYANNNVSIVPCGGTCNYRYAYGRLEK